MDYAPPRSDFRTVPKTLSWQYREDGEFVTKTAEDLFAGKRVVVFAIPGAFTPTCTSKHLPGYEKLFAKLKKAGKLDEIYCLSVNDAFVMDAWFKDLKIKKVKHIPDGALEFTNWADMRINKNYIGFGDRSWRYSVVIDDMITTAWFKEPAGASDDPFKESSAERMLEYLST